MKREIIATLLKAKRPDLARAFARYGVNAARWADTWEGHRAMAQHKYMMKVAATAPSILPPEMNPSARQDGSFVIISLDAVDSEKKWMIKATLGDKNFLESFIKFQVSGKASGKGKEKILATSDPAEYVAHLWKAATKAVKALKEDALRAGRGR